MDNNLGGPEPSLQYRPGLLQLLTLWRVTTYTQGFPPVLEEL